MHSVPVGCDIMQGTCIMEDDNQCCRPRGGGRRRDAAGRKGGARRLNKGEEGRERKGKSVVT